MKIVVILFSFVGLFNFGSTYKCYSCSYPSVKQCGSNFKDEKNGVLPEAECYYGCFSFKYKNQYYPETKYIRGCYSPNDIFERANRPKDYKMCKADFCNKHTLLDNETSENDLTSKNDISSGKSGKQKRHIASSSISKTKRSNAKQDNNKLLFSNNNKRSAKPLMISNHISNKEIIDLKKNKLNKHQANLIPYAPKRDIGSKRNFMSTSSKANHDRENFVNDRNIDLHSVEMIIDEGNESDLYQILALEDKLNETSNFPDEITNDKREDVNSSYYANDDEPDGSVNESTQLSLSDSFQLENQLEIHSSLSNDFQLEVLLTESDTFPINLDNSPQENSSITISPIIEKLLKEQQMEDDEKKTSESTLKRIKGAIGRIFKRVINKGVKMLEESKNKDKKLKLNH